ncbi:MAG: hypothetical protein IJI22_03065 [Bacilli bacterium]|nr:hypothetical protein [Bacilli bacterium]
MNVIFLDFDGTLDTINGQSKEDIERRIKILADICKEYDCKIVIESTLKEALDEETMEIYNPYLQFIFNCFKKYGIDCIGRTPTITKKLGNCAYISSWKEDEIRLYLYRHPEIEHYCVIDDDDLYPDSDLNKVRSHLVKTIYYSKNNPDEEGLLEEHKKEIGEVLKLDNEIKRLIIKREKLKKSKNSLL